MKHAATSTQLKKSRRSAAALRQGLQAKEAQIQQQSVDIAGYRSHVADLAASVKEAPLVRGTVHARACGCVGWSGLLLEDGAPCVLRAEAG